MKKETIDRDMAFADVCRCLIGAYRKNRKRIRFSDLVREAINSRPDRHYISYESALRLLYAMRKGCPREFVNTSTAEKWTELNEQVTRMMRLRPSLSFPGAVACTLACKRPSRFFIPEKRAKAILRMVLDEETMVVTRA